MNLPYLKSEVKLESVVSRESSFLFNNLILLASCFAVLWGTLFPVIMEALTGEKETIDAPYYNRVNVPIALFLIFLTGVGPLIAWRKSSLNSLKRAFLIPVLSSGLRGHRACWPRGFIDCAADFVRTVRVRHRRPSLSEFWKGSRAIQVKGKIALPQGAFRTDLAEHAALWRLSGAHGHCLMFIGFTGSGFNQHETRDWFERELCASAAMI